MRSGVLRIEVQRPLVPALQHFIAGRIVEEKLKINRRHRQVQAALRSLTSEDVEGADGDVDALVRKPHPRIPLPRELFGPRRPNSRGFNLADPLTLAALEAQMNDRPSNWTAAPITGGELASAVNRRAVRNPADLDRVIGTNVDANEALVDRAIGAAHAAQRSGQG